MHGITCDKDEEIKNKNAIIEALTEELNVAFESNIQQKGFT